jgi:hypothetical protein
MEEIVLYIIFRILDRKQEDKIFWTEWLQVLLESRFPFMHGIWSENVCFGLLGHEAVLSCR